MRKGTNSRYSGGRQLCLSLILLAMMAPSWLAPCFANVPDTASYDERLQSLTNNDNYLGDLRGDQVNFWPAASLPIKVFVHPGDDVAGYKPIYLDFLKSALKQWTDATDGKLMFTIVEQPVDDGIEVTWTPKSGHEHGGEAGLAKVKVGAAGIQSANVYLYTFPGDTNAQFDDVGMMGACLHEIGHSMGMPGHSLQPGDIMCAQEVIDPSATTGV